MADLQAVLRLSGRWWPLWPVLGVLGCVGYTLIPSAPGAASFSATSGYFAAVVTILVVRLRRPADPGAWLSFAAGHVFWATGDLVYAVTVMTQGAQPYPSWSDAAYLCAYPFFAVALFRLAGVHRARGVRLIDAGVIVTGLALVYWVFLIGPIAADRSQPALARLVTIGYPTSSVLLIGAVLTLLARTGRRSPSGWMLAMGAVCAAVGNVLYTLFPEVAAVIGPWIYGAFVCAYFCWAGAAVHPSARTADPLPERDGPTPLLLAAGATMLVPAVLFIEGGRTPDHVDWLAVGIGSSVLVLLVMARLLGFVTQVQRQAGQLHDLALRDALTGLANRRVFEERLGAAVATGGAQVAMLDLDGFKDVNDRLGHAVGDRLLTVVAQRLQSALRVGDLVARMGGDEFAVLVPAAMSDVVTRILAVLDRPIEVDGHALLVGASIGTADGTGTADAGELLRRADVAMYAAKNAGLRHRRYAPELDECAGEQAKLAAELRTALDTGQFRLVYQPIVSLPDGRIVSVEALVRWDHPERGFVSPAEFIPVAEQNGLIVELGAWILSTACAQAVTWRTEFGDAAPQRVSVNVSARQLAEPGFPGLVADVLAWTGLGAHHLIVEVTETAVFGGGQTVQAVKDLHELGVRIALDDFGTGHSSLGLLQTVPVDVLKVDKSFVDNITMAGRHAVIATALIQVSNGLGLMAVAEGVETADQAAELHRLGYRLAQGYHFGRPVPQPDFLDTRDAMV
ncbi:bifunctional diguanylate cyclase/phosphodiesterase [Actinoplanes sp. N902-109]|uniref:putative bifunctional diguanylate cyclase/phosphodiesterase n=1 Tax=Actinoplanes sp. (strain N902-109) TaxID=649831 RepID=UPI000329666F|nr:EAL domain-containing protein [Actinoplanes sp. N902-109]AGL17962.1 diguanylate cyclase/phosphodiesterase [Actinoplanes sp. N902-109]